MCMVAIQLSVYSSNQNSSISFKTPRLKVQTALLCSEEVSEESVVQTKKVCKMSPPTPEQMYFIIVHRKLL